MINFRSMFSNVFGKPDHSTDLVTQQIKLLNSYDNYFVPYDGNSYDDATVRTCIDAIARNAAKLRPAHIRRQNNKVINAASSLDSLLSTRPNEYMSSYDFLYKLVTQLYSYNNAFAYVKTDGSGNVLGIYPINYNSLELREYQQELYCRFTFGQSGQITVPYTSLIHLRRHFNRGDIFGESNEQPLQQPLNILNTLKQALENAVKNCTKLRGYLKLAGILKPDDQKNVLDDFTSKFISVNGVNAGSGIAILDSKTDYHELTSDIKTADNEQMSYCREDIYRYFGLSEKIITNSYTEEEWTAFYESVIEPIAIQLSQEFTAKIFSEREKGYGNEVVFQSNRLEYASLKSKTSMIQVLQQTGILTINEARAIFGFDAIPDGDKRLVSLNYVDSDKQNKYQVGTDDSAGGDNDGD